jgi:hypothetical protein
MDMLGELSQSPDNTGSNGDNGRNRLFKPFAWGLHLWFEAFPCAWCSRVCAVHVMRTDHGQVDVTPGTCASSRP